MAQLKSGAARLRLEPQILEHIKERVDQGEYESVSSWIRKACREKLIRDSGGGERSVEQKIFSRLRSIDAGLRLSFSVNAGLARLWMMYFPEPAGLALEANSDTLEERYGHFMADVLALLNGEAGEQYEGHQRQQAVAAS
jgi:Arc/MetJ-type ribon-helix-helix transcriptional regulator